MNIMAEADVGSGRVGSGRVGLQTLYLVELTTASTRRDIAVFLAPIGAFEVCAALQEQREELTCGRNDELADLVAPMKRFRWCKRVV